MNIIRSDFVITSLEAFFHWYGGFVARRPYLVTAMCLLLCACLSIGLIEYKEEGNPYRLWIPQESDFVRNSEWLWKNFPAEHRMHSVIITSDDGNVLRPEVFQLMYKIHQAVNGIKMEDGSTWQDECLQIPVVDMRLAFLGFTSFDDNSAIDTDFSSINDTFDTTTVKTTVSNSTLTENDSISNETLHDRTRRTVETTSRKDPSVEMYPDDYCKLVSKIMLQKCLEQSLLEMIAVDDYGPMTKEYVDTMDTQYILDLFNSANYSQTFFQFTNFTSYLGGVERNNSGHVISAKATIMNFFGRVNSSAIDDTKWTSNRGQPVDEKTLALEKLLVETLLNPELNNDSSIKVFVNVARGFDDLSNESIQTDVFMFGAGFAIVFIYVMVMLGKFNLVEQRPALSLLGIGIIALSVVTTYGICSAMNMIFSPMHNIIPFLLLGIGIDDMFVIVQSLDNIASAKGNEGLKVPEKIALAMKNAGVAITVTSLTDVIVFAVGASTILPALRSFCVYCAIGILVIFVLQCSVFVAALTKDLERIEAKRNGFLLCIQHKNWTPSGFSQRKLMVEAFEKVGKVLCHPLMKVIVLTTSCTLLGFGIWGLTMLRQKFDPIWFLPPNSYLKHWFEANEDFFPKNGQKVVINIGQINYPSELWKISELVLRLRNESDIVVSVDSWISEFSSYLSDNNLFEDLETVIGVNARQFYGWLTQFLFSSDGAKYRESLNFAEDLICGQLAPAVQLSTIKLTHPLFAGPSEHIPAMNRIKELVTGMNFSSRAFPMAIEYASWETDEVIAVETIRNLGLSIICVFLTTIILISSLRTSLCVLLSVVMTLINVGGFMHFWGLTIDVISCVNLVIAVGLCVDYSAHVAHAFMIHQGSRDSRVQQALASIGPAVFNGGFSTFLAFILTSTSESHVFSTFFKIFFLVVIFGLFHGLVMLPVILSLIGPDAYKSSVKTSSNANQVQPSIEPVRILSVKPLSTLDP